MSTRTKRTALGYAVTAIVVVLLVVLALFYSGQRNKTTTIVGQAPAVADKDPEERARLAGMKEVDTAQAAANETGLDILTGESLLTEQLQSTWITESGDEVMEVYVSGLTVVTEKSELGADPAKYYEAVIAEANRPSVYLTDVNGVPALAVEPDTDKLGTNPGLIRFAFNGPSVVLTGEDMPVKYLLQVAQGLKPVTAIASG